MGPGASGWRLCGRGLITVKMAGLRHDTWETGCYLYSDMDGCGPCEDVVALAVSGRRCDMRGSGRFAAGVDGWQSAGMPAAWLVVLVARLVLPEWRRTGKSRR